MAKQAVVQNLSIRAAARYLQDNGVDVGEMRMRNLIRTHPVFTTPSVAGDPNDPAVLASKGAIKSKTGNSEIETWEVKPSALDAYIEAVKSGTVRNAGSGKKFYRIQLDTAQYEALRGWAGANGVPEPERANKNQGNKSKAKAKTNGTAAGETLEGLLADMDEQPVEA
jgi:hypothetical protein